MKKLINLLCLSSILFFSFQFNSQIEYPEDKVSWKFSVEQDGEDATIIAQISLVKHWHIYAANLPAGAFTIPTTIEMPASKNYIVKGKVKEPKPIFVHDEDADEDLYYHSNKIVMKRKIKVKSSKDFVLKGVFGFQTCDDSHCLPPYETDFTLNIKGVSSGDKNDDDDEVEDTVSSMESNDSEKTIDNKVSNKKGNKTDNTTSGNNKKEEKEDQSMWGVFLLAFGSGFLALIMPCVFPMIPMTVSFFTRDKQSKAKGIKNAVLYGGSIVLIHVILGAIVVVTGAGELLNQLSTDVYFNIFFFLMLFIFGLSFLGAFEIQLPSKWVNSADAKADKGGIVGIFFMALVLSLASFSCTGPILGSLLGGLSAYGGSTALMIGMFGFGLALALPFMLFAIFPTWLNSMPSSGGWLNVVKVFLGFLEIAFAFKFLSTADTTMQWHLLEREIFISIWIAVFGTLALYMFGKIRLPHDSPVDKLSVGRSMMATFVLAFTIYLIPGLWGAPLKLVNAFLPPDFYAEAPGGFMKGTNGQNSSSIEVDHIDGMHEGPQGIMAFKDYDKAKAYAKKVNKPLFVDFTGWGCVNCRKMEQSVWGEPGIIDHLRNDVVIVSLYVDERTDLPKNEQKTVNFDGRDIDVVTIGNKWTVKQMSEYKTSSQPYYVMQTPDGKDLSNGSADYQNHSNPNKFKAWLEEGLNELK
jgi:thiol:disulfide interchange protein DsbD